VLNLAVKELLKSTNISRSYQHKYGYMVKTATNQNGDKSKRQHFVFKTVNVSVNIMLI